MEMGNAIFGNSRGEFKVDRDWQEDFCTKLREMGFDGYGMSLTTETENPLFKMSKSKSGEEYYVYENDTFLIKPYYWGDDEEIEQMPNFIYKPTNFELQWYKYALRDSYMNQDISFEEMSHILDECLKSITPNETKL